MNPKIGTLLALIAVSCAGTFIWAVMKSDTVATTAENTGGNGGAGQMLWLWVLLCPPGFLVSVALLGMTFRRRRQGKDRARLQGS